MMMTRTIKEDAVQEPPLAGPAPEPDEPKTMALSQLLGPGGQLVILHGDERYYLRLTSKGRLLLTK